MSSKLSDLTETTLFSDSDEFYVERDPGGARLPRRYKGLVPQRYFPMPQNGISGLTLSNNGADANNDIDIAVGRVGAGSGDYNLILTAALTKQLDAAWVVGTNQGGLDAGSKANSTWYHVWLIARVDTHVVDVLFSTSVSAPTMPANYTMSRRIGAIKTDSSGNIMGFLQYDDQFLWKSPPALDVDDTTLTTVKKTYGLVSVPSGLVVLAKLSVRTNHATSSMIYMSNPNMTDVAPSVTVTPLGQFAPATVSGSQIELYTDTSAQISARATAASTTIRAAVLGWQDPRGKW